MARRTFRLVLTLLILLPAVVSGQSIATIDRTFHIGEVREIPTQPGVVMDLKNGTGITVGKAWIEQWQNGLAVFGRVTAHRAEWARFPGEMDTAAHVVISLSLADKVPMPEVGWGNQFGDTNCAEYAIKPDPRAESCEVWTTRQKQYREQLQRLFIREWRLAPRVSVEALASDSYPRVLSFADDSSRSGLKKLLPDPFLSGWPSGPSLEANGLLDQWSFAALLPWSALPPANSLSLSNLNAVIEIRDRALVASTAVSHKRDDPATFSHFKFIRPRTFTVSRCGYPLSGWFFPAADSVITESFELINAAVGYRYTPEGLSPVAKWNRYFVKELSSREMVCGPDVRFVSGGQVWNYQKYFGDSFDEAHLQQFRLPDGSYLVRSGPTRGTRNPLGTGPCGACETFSFSVYHLDPKNGVRRAFTRSILIDNPDVDNGDIQFSADWKTITVFNASTNYQTGIPPKTVWTSDQYCLSKDNVYETCGPGPTGPPPEPRQIPAQVGP